MTSGGKRYPVKAEAGAGRGRGWQRDLIARVSLMRHRDAQRNSAGWDLGPRSAQSKEGLRGRPHDRRCRPAWRSGVVGARAGVRFWRGLLRFPLRAPLLPSGDGDALGYGRLEDHQSELPMDRRHWRTGMATIGILLISGVWVRLLVPLLRLVNRFTPAI